MRVLLVEEGGVGGVADYTAELSAAIARAGWDVHVATSTDYDYPEAPGVTMHPWFPYVRGRNPLGRAIRRFKLSKPVNGFTHFAANAPVLRLGRHCDIVHVQGGEWPPLGAVQAGLLRAARQPFVWTPHNLFDRFGAGYPRSRDITRRWAARMIVHAEYDRRHLPPASAANAVVIPHGEYGGLTRRAPTQDDPAESRAALGLPEDAIVVLLFGHLRPDKGVRDIALAAREVPEVHLLLAGLDQGGLDDAADVLESPELRERVTVREGFVPFEEMGRVFAASDVAAVPYHVASASGVLLLSYAYKLPVVAYPVGGLPEYVSNGETGWLCPAQDPAALADSLRDVVARGRDECRARGEAALRYSHTHFSWDEIARRTTELYVNVLNRT